MEVTIGFQLCRRSKGEMPDVEQTRRQIQCTTDVCERQEDYTEIGNQYRKGEVLTLQEYHSLTLPQMLSQMSAYQQWETLIRTIFLPDLT